MADRKLSASTELAAEPADGDLLLVVDVSDTTDGAGGTNKKTLWSTIKDIWVRSSLGTAANDFMVATGVGTWGVQSPATVRTTLNVEDGADVTDTINVGEALDLADDKTTPVDADMLALLDTEAANVVTRLSLTNLKAFLKTYFDTLYSVTGAVMSSLFDAHTILYATTDNTPAALTVGEQTVVGRATGGNIAAIVIDSDLSSVSGSDDTIPSAKATKTALDAKLGLDGGTLTGEVNLGENAGLLLDAALSADGKYSGITRSGTAGAALAFGDLCYLSVADSRWELADADAEATAFGLLGICVLAAAADADPTKLLLWGTVRADTAFPALTVGAPVFMGTTAGDIQTAVPSGSADIIRIVGQGYTADELLFCPSPDYYEHA